MLVTRYSPERGLPHLSLAIQYLVAESISYLVLPPRNPDVLGFSLLFQCIVKIGSLLQKISVRNGFTRSIYPSIPGLLINSILHTLNRVSRV